MGHGGNEPLQKGGRWGINERPETRRLTAAGTDPILRSHALAQAPGYDYTFKTVMAEAPPEIRLREQFPNGQSNDDADAAAVSWGLGLAARLPGMCAPRLVQQPVGGARFVLGVPDSWGPSAQPLRLCYRFAGFGGEPC